MEVEIQREVVVSEVEAAVAVAVVEAQAVVVVVVAVVLSGGGGGGGGGGDGSGGGVRGSSLKQCNLYDGRLTKINLNERICVTLCSAPGITKCSSYLNTDTTA